MSSAPRLVTISTLPELLMAECQLAAPLEGTKRGHTASLWTWPSNVREIASMLCAWKTRIRVL
jgi:hypothetical protein